jgi:hypothetical protein
VDWKIGDDTGRADVVARRVWIAAVAALRRGSAMTPDPAHGIACLQAFGKMMLNAAQTLRHSFARARINHR